MLSKIRSFVLTMPSGSMSSKCFGVVFSSPVKTYWPGLPWDSLTRKSPSFLRRPSATGRLIDGWNHDSVISCERCTSAESENGSGNWKNEKSKNALFTSQINWNAQDLSYTLTNHMEYCLAYDDTSVRFSSKKNLRTFCLWKMFSDSQKHANTLGGGH